MTEQQIQKQILDLIKSKNGYAVKVIAANRGGIPDILACVPVKITQDMVGQTRGLFVAIEVKKKENERPKDLQRFNLFSIADSLGISATARGKKGIAKTERIINILRNGKLPTLQDLSLDDLPRNTDIEDII